MPKRIAQRTVSLEVLQRGASFLPSTFDAEKRTVELVWTTGARVRRRGFFREDWDEELGLDDGEVRMGRLQNGAPLLDNHGMSNLQRAQIGVVEKAWWVGRGKRREGRALVRFSERQEVEDVLLDVQTGVLRGVSVGYRVHKLRDITTKKDEVQVLRAIDWEPLELTLTPIQADAGGLVRNDDTAGVAPCVLIGSAPSDPGSPATRSKPMTWNEILSALVRTAGLAASFAVELAQRDDLEENDLDGAHRLIEAEQKRLAEEKRTAAAAAAAAATPPADPPVPGRGEIDTAIRAERERSHALRELCRKHNLPDTFAEDLVARGVTVAAASSEVLERLAARTQENGVVGSTSTRTGVQVGEEVLDKARAGIEAALDHRVGVASELAEEGRAFRGMSLIRMGEELLRIRGVSYDHRPADLSLRIMGAHGTDDFPSILANVANKRLRKAYSAAPRTYQAISRQSDAPDFKPMSRVAIGLGSSLQKVDEHGEFRWGTFTEAGETYSIDEYGRVIAITRKAIINDDTSAFGRIPQAFGAQAALLENLSAWNLLLNNVVMGDGVALFAAGHGNELTPDTALGETGLSEIRAAMRKQTDPDGNPLNLNPRVLIVPADLETTAQRLTAQLTPAASTSVNPFASQFAQVVVESLLDAAAGGATRWFVAADPDQIDVLEHAYLDGNDGPMIETQDGFEVSGVKMRVRHDFGVAPLDFRGIARSNGTT